MKWTALRPDPKTFDFTAADKIVEFAVAHSMKVRGHTLVWGKHNPEWLEKTAPADRPNLLHEHIRRTVEHFRGRVFAWDVVNEALDEHGKPRESIWSAQPDYVEQSFRWAHAADPQALLFYNEAEAENLGEKSDALYAMVKDFKRRGVPIAGVGMQLHILDLKFDSKSVAANITRLTALGFQVHITELDVAITNDSELPRQAEIYRQVATVCLSNPGCTALQTWGFTDKYSWIGWYTNHSKGDALPFDRSYRPKPAYQTLSEALAQPRTRN
jgi:endo-1,4-beta-xylanase